MPASLRHLTSLHVYMMQHPLQDKVEIRQHVPSQEKSTWTHECVRESLFALEVCMVLKIKESLLADAVNLATCMGSSMLPAPARVKARQLMSYTVAVTDQHGYQHSKRRTTPVAGGCGTQYICIHYMDEVKAQLL